MAVAMSKINGHAHYIVYILKTLITWERAGTEKRKGQAIDFISPFANSHRILRSPAEICASRSL